MEIQKHQQGYPPKSAAGARPQRKEIIHRPSEEKLSSRNQGGTKLVLLSLCFLVVVDESEIHRVKDDKGAVIAEVQLQGDIDAI